MKHTNALAALAFATYVVIALSACSQTKDNTVASTPAETCAYNPQYGTYTYPSGAQCSVSGTGSTCTAQGYYAGPNGQQVACTPGQGYYPPPTGYPYQANPQQSCQGWSQVYPGAIYVPMILNGQMVCVNYATLTQSIPASSGYYSSEYATYGAGYYYSYPPYGYSSGYGGGGGGGGGCGTSIAIAVEGFAGAACF